MYLIPQPKSIQLTDGVLKAGEFDIVTNQSMSSKLEVGKDLFLADVKKARLQGKTKLHVHISDAKDEAYEIQVKDEGIFVSGGEPGIFWAFQTLRQIVNTEKCFPYCVVKDAPDFSIRGISYDVTRGRVPTLEGLKKIADFCVYFKINMLKLYFEYSFPFPEFEKIVEPYERLEEEELREYAKYCAERCIELVPYVAVFGHQYRLLQSEQYADLCELVDYKPTKHYWYERMSHHTFDVSNPRSHEMVKGFLDKMADIFPSVYQAPGVDETMDLCKGRNAGKDVVELYRSFLGEICEHLEKKDRIALVADDVIMRHNMVDFKPENVIYCHWDYSRKPNEERFKILQENKIKYVAMPSVWSYNSVVENLVFSVENITNMLNYAYKYGAMGVVNTVWGDFGHFCEFNCTLYSLALGCGKSWNIKTEATKEFEKEFSVLAFAETEGNFVDDVIRVLGRVQAAANIYYLVTWYNKVLIGKEDYMPEYTSIKDATESIEISKAYAKKMAQKSQQFPNRKELYHSFAVAFGLCEALNIITLAILEKTTIAKEDLGIIQTRLEEFHESWLRDNKEGEFAQIATFIDDILTYLKESYEVSL